MRNIFPKLFFLVTATLFLILGSGCGPSERELKLQAELDRLKKEQEVITVSGNVFVATKGGTNYKLALVPVAAFPSSKFESLLKASLERSTFALRKKEQEILSQIESYAETVKEYKTKSKRHSELYSDFDRLWSHLRDQGASGFDGKVSLPRDYSKGLLGRKTYKFIPEFNRIVEMQRLMAGEAMTLYPLWEKLADQRSALLKTIRDFAPSENALRGGLADLRESAIGLATSDADGNFSISLKRSSEKQIVLVATGKRQVGKDEEKYLWISKAQVPSESNKIVVMLSNNELADEDDLLAKFAVQFKEINPDSLEYVGSPWRTVFKLEE